MHNLGLGLSLNSRVPSRKHGANDLRGVLGSKLKACWDAERADLITQSSGVISAWSDTVAGYVMTASGAPAYSATSFNTRPGVTLNGSTDYFTCSDATMLASLPIGSDAGEIWAVVSQDYVGASNINLFAIGYGGASSSSARGLLRSNVSGNRARMQAGDGVSTIIGPVNDADFTGRHLLRGQVDPSTVTLTYDNASPFSLALVAATQRTRARIGASAINTANGFWLGQISLVMFCDALNSNDVTNVRNILNGRV